MDQQKRNSLKIMSGVGIAACTTTLSGLASAAVGVSNQVNLERLPVALPRSTSELEIQIVSSQAIPEDSVVIRNATDAPIVLTEFMPGHIVFEDRILNINSILNEQPIDLNPGQVIAVRVEILELLAMPPTEYVWAEHAIEQLSVETQVITLGAFLSDSKGILFPMPVTKQFA